MKFAPTNRVHRALAAGAGVLALLATSGCGAVNEQATTRQYSASDGIVTSVGPVDVRNLLIVANDAESSGRFLGTVVNTSDSPVQLTLAVASDSASVTIPADGQIKFEDEAHTTEVDAAGADAGALAPVTLRVNSESSEVRVPVLDAALAEYGAYLESPQPTGTASPTSPAGEPTTTAPAEEAPGH